LRPTNVVTHSVVTDSRVTNDAVANSGMSQVVTLLCCVEAIDHQLTVCRAEDRWHWQSRRNSAVFLLNRLADSAAVQRTHIDIGHLPPRQRRAIAERHSLLCPLDL